MANVNKSVTGAREYYPLNEPEIGVALPKVQAPFLLINVHTKKSLMAP